MPDPNGTLPPPDERFARVFAEIDRIDQRHGDFKESQLQLGTERDRRMEDRFKGQETATSAALTAAKEAVAAAQTASEKAINKAEIAQTKVNDGQNEFRATLRDQATLFMPRSETENLVRELRGLLNSANAEIGTLRSRVDVGPPSLQQLQSSADKSTGRTAGALDTRTLIFSLIGAGGAVIGVVAFLLR